MYIIKSFKPLVGCRVGRLCHEATYVLPHRCMAYNYRGTEWVTHNEILSEVEMRKTGISFFYVTFFSINVPHDAALLLKCLAAI